MIGTMVNVIKVSDDDDGDRKVNILCVNIYFCISIQKMTSTDSYGYLQVYGVLSVSRCMSKTKTISSNNLSQIAFGLKFKI